ncbi:hypothetical protein CFC21_086348 [Triticum aestivum]|uniref:Uncharacterized protein n=2 Tax=Triticum aestivum TaxID=4565 RepID=A0A9R1L9K1_WHEAT|nr:uncharacterized protein LOC123135635 [Triticum aestivum]KAF7082479.1 hypothetical protein CFC21_086348 [Triticum aestivum]CDJ26649.1 unnamed protein product [Triticum aestivum]
MPLLPPAPPPLPLSSHRLGLPFLSPHSPAGRPLRRGDLAIRMGGGPRTFPGGVSKWQWKRMQARKAKQLLKARLARERQLYEMRKRAELRDAVVHLERPWDPDSAPVSAAALAPNLLSVAADDQLRGLADRFHRPGGVDLWNDRDGPQVLASPGTGLASARFFPRNAVHSVQPYARLGAGERVRGVRRNDAVEDAYGYGEPAVQLMERDGMWEPVIALEAGDEDNSSVRSWIHDDEDAISDSDDDEEDADFGHQQRAMVRRDGRRSGETASTMRVGSERGSHWRGHGSLSDSEGARKGHLDQRWPDRSSGSRRKPPAARWKPWNAEGSNAIGKDRIGGGSFSESEVSRRGFEPKSRARNREDTMDAVVKWKLSYDSHGNVIRKVRVGGEFDSNSDSGREDKLEQKWGARNRSSPGENRRGRAGLKHRPKANSGERPGGYTRGHNGDERDQSGNGFASDLEEPTWKPRKKNEARSSNGSREYNSDMEGRFRSGGSGAARRLDSTRPVMNTNREDGGGRRSRGDGYSLRPTSELHSSMDRNGGRQFRGDGYSLRPTSELR